MHDEDTGSTSRSAGRPVGRTPRVAEDGTPLNGATVDVAARIGWLSRTARQLYGGEGLRRLQDMAVATGFPRPRLQRMETGTLRDRDVLTAYEVALERPEGSLVAPVDVLCRTFPAVAPEDRGRPEPESVESMSRMTEDLLGDTPVEGGTWLRWARAMGADGGIGMPRSIASMIVFRLIEELARSTASGYVSRYEALSILRCGPYGDLVLELARRWVSDPHVQASSDLISAVGESDSVAATDWFLELLADDRDRLVVGGALGIEAAGAVTQDPHFWARLLPRLVVAHDEARPGSVLRGWTSHLLRLVPANTWRREQVRLSSPLAARPAVRDWSRTRTNAHWTWCSAGADRTASRLGLPAGPMLARLMFDIAVSPHETRAVTSYMLLGGLPELAEVVGAELATLAEEHEDPLLRARVARRLPSLIGGRLPDRVRSWADSDEPELRSAALYAAGSAGVHLPVGLLEAPTRGEGFPAAAVYSTGMSAHPVLETWLTHEREDVAGAAAWWLRHGPRIAR